MNQTGHRTKKCERFLTLSESLLQYAGFGNIKQMIKFFSIGKKKENTQEVKAHVNVHTMLFGNYVNLDFDISVQSGTTVKKMVKLKKIIIVILKN